MICAGGAGAVPPGARRVRLRSAALQSLSTGSVRAEKERHSRRHAVQLDHWPVPARHAPAERDVAAREFRLGDQRLSADLEVCRRTQDRRSRGRPHHGDTSV